MLATNPAPFLKPWGVSVEKVVVEDGSKITFLSIASAPGRALDFGGIPVVSDDYQILYATEDVALAERDKVTVLEGPHVGSYSVREVTTSTDNVFSTAKLKRIL